MDAFEYQVYDGELNKPGQLSLETHLNSILVGKREADYEEKIPDNHLTHLTFEFARGMNEFWELGAYLQSALSPDGVYHYAGVKLRSKFARRGTEKNPLQYGINFELSNIPPQFEPERWGSEVRPIVGYTWRRLTVLLNPILDINLTRGRSATPDFTPATKVMIDTRSGYALGVEYYGDAGEVGKMPGFGRTEQYLFAAFDCLGGPVELNLGVGTGLTSESNSTLVKGIFGFAF